MSLTTPIPLAYRLLALVLLAIALYASGVVHGMKLGEKDLDDYRIAEQAATITAQAVAAEKTRTMQSRKDGALHDAQVRAESNARAAAAARHESDSLRDDIARARRDLSNASADAVRRYADAAGAVLGDCAAAYSAMATVADSERSDSLTLQASWPK